MQIYAPILAFILAWILTRLVKQYAGKIHLVHALNQRSSHTKLTPHGGGVGIVLAFIIVSVGILWQENASYTTMWAIIGLCVVIAIVGLMDDIHHVAAYWRLLTHAVVCLVMFLGISRLSVPNLPDILVLPFWLTVAAIVFAGSWWINLFNFMDGIDGLAGAQAIFMLLAAAALSVTVNHEAADTTVWLWMICLAAATIGFLLHNWPPAKIFMGDVGSTFLAFMLFFFALITISLGWLNYAVWVILSALFVSDATVTLVRRILTKQKWFAAHRSHAYQNLSRYWGSHLAVTIFYIAINLVWLLPLAWLALRYPVHSRWLVLTAYLPIILLVYRLGAGQPEEFLNRFKANRNLN